MLWRDAQFASMSTKDSPLNNWIFRPTRVGILFSACLGVCAFAFAQDGKLATAESAISARIAKSGADVAVYFRTLDGRAQWSVRADDVFHAASTMKIPVMIELFHQVQESKLKLTDTLLIKNEFHSIVDGSPYMLNASDDSEGELYKAEGQKRTLRELVRTDDYGQQQSCDESAD